MISRAFALALLLVALLSCLASAEELATAEPGNQDDLTDADEEDLCIVMPIDLKTGYQLNHFWEEPCNQTCRCVSRSEPLNRSIDMMLTLTENFKVNSSIKTEIRCGVPANCSIEVPPPTPECPYPRLLLPSINLPTCTCPHISCNLPHHLFQRPSSQPAANSSTTKATTTAPQPPPATNSPSLATVSGLPFQRLYPATSAPSTSAQPTTTISTSASNNNSLSRTLVTSTTTEPPPPPTTTEAAPEPETQPSPPPAPVTTTSEPSSTTTTTTTTTTTPLPTTTTTDQFERSPAPPRSSSLEPSFVAQENSTSRAIGNNFSNENSLIAALCHRNVYEISSFEEKITITIHAYAIHLLFALLIMTLLFFVVLYLYLKKSTKIIVPITTSKNQYYDYKSEQMAAYDNSAYNKFIQFPRVLLVGGDEAGNQNCDNAAKQKNTELDMASPLNAQFSNGRQHLI